MFIPVPSTREESSLYFLLVQLLLVFENLSYRPQYYRGSCSGRDTVNPRQMFYSDFCRSVSKPARLNHDFRVDERIFRFNCDFVEQISLNNFECTIDIKIFDIEYPFQNQVVNKTCYFSV